MGERETKEIKAGNHTIVVKTYLTAREANALKALIQSKIGYTIEDGIQTQKLNLDGTYLMEQELKALELVVVSLDGKTENVLELIQDLPADQYQKIVNGVNAVTQDPFHLVK